MTHYLAVWSGVSAITNLDAAKRYAALLDGTASQTFDPDVYAFRCDLISCFPDVEMTGEEDLDGCPWASSLELSEGHLIMPVRPEHLPAVLPLVLQLAEKHGLVCFDPQTTVVHLPSRLLT